MKIKIIFIIFIFNLIAANNENNMKIPIIPKPQLIELTGKNFVFESGTEIFTNSKDTRLQTTINELLILVKNKCDKSAYLNDQKLNSTIQLLIISKSEASKLIPEKFINESYELKINKENIIITAVNERGLHYGIQSLIQLIENAKLGSLPGLSIIDYPDMSVRGISDDISRGQVSNLENFKKIISFLSRHKMNTYMPYMEDVIQFDKYPTIGKNRGALSKSEIEEIVQFAEKNFIEVIPIFQTLGHYENILVQAEYLKYAEFPGAASLNVSDNKIYEFLEDMLIEVFKLFPSKYFHMGADESYDVGFGNSKSLVDKYGLAMVHAEHYKKVYDICKKHGKEVMMYGDIILNHPEILEVLPKDITIVDWHYRADNEYPSTKLFQKYGFNYFVSPSVWNFLTTYPTNINAIPNIQYITEAGLKNNSSGMINSNWGDYGAETFKELVYYSYAWSAQCSWNYEESDIYEFSNLFFRDFFGNDDPRIIEIYNSLSDSFNQIVWHELWAHPYLPFRPVNWWEPNVSRAVKISWMKITLPKLKEYIVELKSQVNKNNDNLELVEFLIDLNFWYIKKIELQFILNKIRENNTIENEKDLYSLIDEVSTGILKLKEEYGNLWKKYYKPDNLNMIEDKFNRMADYLNETKEFVNRKLNNDDLFPYNEKYPLLETDWLYLRESDSTFFKNAYFKKSFILNSIPDSAYIQLLGDTFVKLYVNDQLVETVFARRSLSLLVDYYRIKFIDIKKYLVEGENNILVEVENFNNKGSAGFNLTSAFFSAEKTVNRVGTFVTEINDTEKWYGSIDKQKWSDVAVRPYPFRIIAPNFKTKKISWIER